ncbi:MAG TPA: hypothetical protein VIW69_02720, partial [Candidatus Elarobacter sp.]
MALVAQTFTLTLEIAEASLRLLTESDVQIVVAKTPAGGSPGVAWLVWEPAPLNTVIWEETYGIYAAELPEHDGAPIRMTASIYPARERSIYRYRDTSFAEPLASQRIPPRHFDVSNDTASSSAFGLLQAATINGELVRAPVTVVVVPSTFTADFAAVTTVHVWTQAAGAGGIVAPDRA